MLSGRLCRSCRLRLYGPHNLSALGKQGFATPISGSQQIRHLLGSAAGSADEAKTAPLERRTQFPDFDSLDIPRPLPESRLPPREVPSDSTQRSRWSPRIPAVAAESRFTQQQRYSRHGNDPDGSRRSRGASSHPTRRPSRGKVDGSVISASKDHTQPTFQGQHQDNPNPRQRYTQARRTILPRPQSVAALATSSDALLPPAPSVWRSIRRRWRIPYNKKSHQEPVNHMRVQAYFPIHTQLYHAWGSFRHVLRESVLSKAEQKEERKAFERWYRTLGLLTVEPHRLEKLVWRNEAAWLLDRPSVAEMHAAWMKLDAAERRRRWPHTMLSAMILSPAHAVDVLAATMSPLPPGYAIASVLQFVALNLHQHWPLSFREQVARGEAIVNLMEEIIIHCPKDHTRPSQLTLGIFAQMLPSDQCKILYDLLNKGGIALKEDAALHFAETLSKQMESKQIALDILLDLANKGTDLNKPKVASVITTLLHCHRHANIDSEVPETSSSFSKQALEALMEYDFVPNFINLTAFLDSLCWDGELDEAIRLALLFTESGARLDGRTFANIFRAAKASRDPELMRRALDVAKVANAPIVGVLNNALHAVFYCNEMESKDAVMAKQEGPQVFLEMLRLYAQRFTLEPLQTLFPESLALILANSPSPGTEELGKTTTLAVAQAFFKDADIPKREPDATTLAIMLRAYVRSLHYPQDIVYFYEYFKSRLESNGDRGVNFARQVVEKHRSLIHDTVLLSMLQHSMPTRESLQVLGDMLRDNLPSQTAGSTDNLKTSDAQEEHKPVHPAPTIFTLSIMISRLLRRKETMVAEQLMDVMKEHGIEPNLALWNSLVKGYALMQDVPQTVRTLQQLEATGHKPDDRTYKAFNSLRDQGRALELMDQIIRDNTARLAEDHSS